MEVVLQVLEDISLNKKSIESIDEDFVRKYILDYINILIIRYYRYNFILLLIMKNFSHIVFELSNKSITQLQQINKQIDELNKSRSLSAQDLVKTLQNICYFPTPIKELIAEAVRKWISNIHLSIYDEVMARGGMVYSANMTIIDNNKYLTVGVRTEYGEYYFNTKYMFIYSNLEFIPTDVQYIDKIAVSNIQDVDNAVNVIKSTKCNLLYISTNLVAIESFYKNFVIEVRKEHRELLNNAEYFGDKKLIKKALLHSSNFKSWNKYIAAVAIKIRIKFDKK